MKREFEVWLSECGAGRLVNDHDHDFWVSKTKNGNSKFKAKLIVEMPEEKIELSWGQIKDALFKHLIGHTSNEIDYRQNEIKEQLGFKE